VAAAAAAATAAAAAASRRCEFGQQRHEPETTVNQSISQPVSAVT